MTYVEELNEALEDAIRNAVEFVGWESNSDDRFILMITHKRGEEFSVKVIDTQAN